MKKKWTMIIAIIITFILQTSLFNYFRLANVRVNFPLILLVVFAIQTDAINGALLGMLTGILYDTMIFDVFGVYTLIYFIIGSIIGSFNSELIRENNLVYSLITAISTFFGNILLFLILFFLKYSFENWLLTLSKIILETLLNSIFVLVILSIVKLIFTKLKIRVQD